MTEKTVSLILAFLHTKQNKIFSNIQTSRHDGRYPYVHITFCYSGLDVSVRVYNDSFIKLIVDDEPWNICDSIQTFRDTIYNLENLNYGRDY